MSDIDINNGFEEEFTEHSLHKNSTKTFHHEPCGEINFKTETELKYFFRIWSPIESCKEELEDEGAGRGEDGRLKAAALGRRFCQILSS